MPVSQESLDRSRYQALACPRETSVFSDSIQTMSSITDNLTLFDRINLADCAKRRAVDNVLNSTRFSGEYDTARLWMKYRLVKYTDYSFIDDN
jgi:hypothetical protein